MNQPNIPPRRNPLYPLMILILMLCVVGGAAWTATTAPALGFSGAIPTPTQWSSFAFAQIAKPTYTASPTATLIIPTQIPTETIEPMVLAEIVSESLTYDYVASVTQDDEQAPLFYGGNKYILVDISEQHMYVYEGDVLVYSFVASTGMNNATRVGNFSVLNKIPSAYGSTWNIWMPNWLGIYWAGSLQNGIHALPILPNGAQLWAGYLGVPISYGCVVLGAYEAQLLYDWAEVGTPVEIRW
ncbi:MAG: L,D-transpeptidase [Anaerolineales bacterium]|nr:MAG: L,D-transpeptidase [Anaerolineales bacterium]